MENLKSILVLTVLMMALSLSFCQGSPEPAVTKGAEDLNSRWEWAIKTAQARKIAGEFWIGYSIEHWMGEESHIGCHDSRDSHKSPFEKMLEKSINFETMIAVVYDKPAKPERKTEMLVLRELAILFKSKLTSNGNLEFSDVALTDLDSHFSLKELPLIWLDLVDRHESAHHLKMLYEKDAHKNSKKDLIVALGLHQDCEIAFEKLKNIVTGDEPNDLRKDAVFWLAQYPNKDVLDLLKKVARNDKAESVQEQAVFALYLIKSDEATDELLDLARKAENQEVRKKAIFWLGQVAGEKATMALENVVYNDQETEIQKQAVFALSQLPAKQGLEKLIKVARTHPNSETRKQAIFWIGQCGDESAVDFLMDIIKGK